MTTSPSTAIASTSNVPETLLGRNLDDLRFATNQERRFALAYLGWLAGGQGRRRSQPHATHSTYALTPERGQQIREDIESMVRDAAEQLRQSLRRAAPLAA